MNPDALGHRTRISDSSIYSEVCVDCGATDANGYDRLRKRCPGPREGGGTMKPTREELEFWASRINAGSDLARAAHYALDLEREVAALRTENARLASANRVLVGEEHTLRCEVAALARSIGQPVPAAPSPLLDDALWRRVFAAAAVTGTYTVDSDCENIAKVAVKQADALLTALREREGRP